MLIYNLELHKRTFANFFRKLFEPKHVQVFPLKIQYLKEVSDFFRKKSEEAYEFHMISNSTVRSTV